MPHFHNRPPCTSPWKSASAPAQARPMPRSNPRPVWSPPSAPQSAKGCRESGRFSPHHHRSHPAPSNDPTASSRPNNPPALPQSEPQPQTVPAPPPGSFRQIPPRRRNQPGKSSSPSTKSSRPVRTGSFRCGSLSRPESAHKSAPEGRPLLSPTPSGPAEGSAPPRRTRPAPASPTGRRTAPLKPSPPPPPRAQKRKWSWPDHSRPLWRHTCKIRSPRSCIQPSHHSLFFKKL